MNNKGMTITELLVSICIISIVILLLFSLLLQVKEQNNKNNVQSTFILNQATIIKAIEEDAVDYDIKRISSCSLSEMGIDPTIIVKGYEDKYKCIKIEYKKDFLKSNIAFLAVYNYYTKYVYTSNGYVNSDESEKSWMISYKRGYYKNYNGDGTPNYKTFETESSIMKELPEELDMSNSSTLKYTALSDNINAASLVLPVVNLNGEHYDINIGFTYQGNNLFKCKSNDADYNKFICDCKSGTSLCNEINE